MVMLIWGCKACLLLLYNKLTFGLKAQWSVKIVAVYCGVSLVVMEVLYFGVWCRPVSNYWRVPVDNGKYLFKRHWQTLIITSTMLGSHQSPHHECCV